MTEIKDMFCFWSALAANLCVCKHHTNQSAAITSVDWFTTVIPWRQFTVVDIQVTFLLLQSYGVGSKKELSRKGLCSQQHAWTPGPVSQRESQPSHQIAVPSLHTRMTNKAAMLLSACISSPNRWKILHLFTNRVGEKTIIHFSIHVFVFLLTIQKSKTWQSRSLSGNKPVKNKLCEI